MLRAEAVALLVMAVALAWPIPAALARARWTARDPGVALVLWQAVGLAGGLSILGAGCTLAVSDLHRGWLGGMAALPTSAARLGPVGWTGVGLTVAAGLWLAGVAAASALRVTLDRREHRLRLDAVAETLDARPRSTRPGPAGTGTRTAALALAGVAAVPDVCCIDHPVAVAYSLPGVRTRIVVSRGALRALDADELDAVLAHEEAHARSRHDLVVQPFMAWRETFPFLRPATAALGAVEGLVEMLADDRARQDCSPAALRRALRQMASEQVAVAPAAAPRLDGTVEARVARLAVAPRPLARPVRLLVLVAAAVLVLGPPIALLVS
ncbi:MAG TPA: M56 family metallopeptidase [Acidimicrobiales bacterium]|nr:M56 family metallopeptidase [Acidimicrobiales bacterium]